MSKDMADPFRIDVPEGALYGAQTALALRNFNISGRTLQREFVLAHLQVKEAAAIANMEKGLLSRDVGEAIAKACKEAARGRYADQFPVDVYQAGAGTSVNMNVNEVVATLAGASLGRAVHPNDHVNLMQSTNDTVPTSTMVACRGILQHRLLPALDGLSEALREKAEEYGDVVKPGRTHLQDAVLTTWGSVFGGWASSVEAARDGFAPSLETLSAVPLGGNAVGTGANTPEGYREVAVRALSQVVGMEFRPARDPVSVTQNPLSFQMLASALSDTARTLSRIAGDVILLSSGPGAGLGELVLTPLQPGSSFMPGKVNPVMAEMMKMACCQVQGNCAAVHQGFQEGALELNVTMPMMAWNLIDSLNILSNAVSSFTKKCVSGMKVDRERCRMLADTSLGAVTYLVPMFGYDECARLARLAQRSGRTLEEVVSEEKGLPAERVRELLRGR